MHIVIYMYMYFLKKRKYYLKNASINKIYYVFF